MWQITTATVIESDLDGEAKPQRLPALPIPNVDNDTKQHVMDLVGQIRELKKTDDDTTALESQIDEMVYDLYDLTEEEKEIVRNST